jgi:hypothetical protein
VWILVVSTFVGKEAIRSCFRYVGGCGSYRSCVWSACQTPNIAIITEHLSSSRTLGMLATTAKLNSSSTHVIRPSASSAAYTDTLLIRPPIALQHSLGAISATPSKRGVLSFPKASSSCVSRNIRSKHALGLHASVEVLQW